MHFQFDGKEISLTGLGGYGLELVIDPQATGATITLPDDARPRVFEQGNTLVIEADGASLWPEGESYDSHQQINANNGGVIMAPMQGNITFDTWPSVDMTMVQGSSSLVRDARTYGNGVIKTKEVSSDGTTTFILVRSRNETPEVTITVPPAVNNVPPVRVMLDGECFFLPERSSMM